MPPIWSCHRWGLAPGHPSIAEFLALDQVRSELLWMFRPERTGQTTGWADRKVCGSKLGDLGLGFFPNATWTKERVLQVLTHSSIHLVLLSRKLSLIWASRWELRDRIRVLLWCEGHQKPWEWLFVPRMCRRSDRDLPWRDSKWHQTTLHYEQGIEKDSSWGFLRFFPARWMNSHVHRSFW